MTAYITFKAHEARQHGRKLLVGVISAKDLARLYETKTIQVDQFSSTNPDGYQRSLSITRSRKFGRFVQDKDRGISPTSILLYCRESDGNIQQVGPGNYRIPLWDGEGKPSLYICDGQHRTAGFLEAIKEGWLEQDEAYDVPIDILFYDPEGPGGSDPRLEEAMQFYTINQTQKRMRTDLAHQYIFRQHESSKGPIGDGTRLLRMKKTEYVPYEVYIAKRMRTDPDSPWKGLISVPNEQAGPISELSFTDSLAPIISYAIQANLTVGELLTLLKHYWEAIFSLCPAAKQDPAAYVLMKTPGVYSLHLLLPVILIRKPNLGSAPSTAQMKAVLASIGDKFTDLFWDSSSGEAATFGTSKKAFQELSDDIAGELL